jgi:hypothetical protein
MARFVSVQSKGQRSLRMLESSLVSEVHRLSRNRNVLVIFRAIFIRRSLGELFTADGVRCEDLESLTFQNEAVDLVITQDVIKHVVDPDP